MLRTSMGGNLDMETPPVWLWDGPIAPIRPVQSGAEAVDVLVVGAGMTGTATAYYLAEQRPDLTVMLVEAQHVGLGATARSTGIIGPGVSAGLSWLRRRHGDTIAAKAFRSTCDGAAEVERLVQAEGIACDARLEQHVVAALTAGQRRKMLRHTHDLAALGFAVQWWDEQAVRDRLGDAYRAAYGYDDVLLVNPYQLVTGLAAAAERRGVRIHERTRVRHLEPRSDGVLAHTPAGVIDARSVLLATDGYSGSLNPLASAVVPVRTHVVATAPLTAEQQAGLGWDGRGGVIDQRNFFSYYRLGAGGRLLFGGGPALFPTGDVRRDALASAAAFARVEQELRERFPALDDVRVEARWSGLTGGTLDRLPVVGPIRQNPRVLFAGGWCGHGLSMSVTAARHSAQLLAGGAQGTRGAHLPWHRGSTGGLPSQAVRSTVVPTYLRVMDWQDRVQQHRAVRRPASPAGTRQRPADTKAPALAGARSGERHED
jgi:gamma-glutamylputrescine oxidase